MDRKISNMIKRMAEKEKSKHKALRGKKVKGPCWSVYILQCGDGSLYTGATNDLARRFEMHSRGKGAKYTRARLPVDLVYQEVCGTRTQALVREMNLKSLPRGKKEILISGCEGGKF